MPQKLGSFCFHRGDKVPLSNLSPFTSKRRQDSENVGSLAQTNELPYIVGRVKGNQRQTAQTFSSQHPFPDMMIQKCTGPDYLSEMVQKNDLGE